MPRQPFLALITPVGDTGPADPGYSPPWAQVPPGQVPTPPPGIWPGPRPSHPIMLPGMPGWGGGGPVDPGYSPPWARPPVDPGYSPPWARPGGGPVDPGYGIPETGVPRPMPPIYIPPEGSQPPLGIWGGPYFPPVPAHPIVLPPDLPPVIPPTDGQPERKIEWKTAWTPTTGWVVVGIPAEGTLVPTPSAPPA